MRPDLEIDYRSLKEGKFRETIETGIVNNEMLANIENLTYLRGYLEGKALQAIEGFPLTSENYGNT